MSEDDEVYMLKAHMLWKAMNDSEKHGIRFGLFPGKYMVEAESQGFNDVRKLTCALMAVADRHGGMRG